MEFWPVCGKKAVKFKKSEFSRLVICGAQALLIWWLWKVKGMDSMLYHVPKMAKIIVMHDIF